MPDPHVVEPHKHNPKQHRDGKEPWCEECGLTAIFTEPKALTYHKLIGGKPEGVPDIMRFFNYSHLPHSLAVISKPFCELAWEMYDKLEDGRQKEMFLEFLLLAKDAAVRTAV